MKSPRLIPMVVVAASLLLGLKVLAFTLASNVSAQERMLGAIQYFKGPVVVGQGKAQKAIDPATGIEVDPIVTGSGAAPAEGGHGGGEAPKEGGPAAAPAKPDYKISPDRPAEVQPLPGQQLKSEIEVLQKLAERRKQLDEMERQLKMREDLLKAAEDRIGKRVDELQTIEGKIGTDVQKKDEAKKQELSDLVKMYESMKAKDAARVFDRLDITLLGEIARQMNPKKLGDVIAKMQPEVAEKLTIELANRKGTETAQPAGRDLPKIQGRS